MKKIFCIAFIILISVLSVVGKNPEWFDKLKKLQKFPSTEKDVERLFNSPKIIYSSDTKKVDELLTKIIKYELPEGVLDVYYSAGKCSETNTKGYDLGDGVILNYDFNLRPRIELSKMQLNLKDLQTAREDDSGFIFFYDSKKGFRYSSLGNLFTSFEFSVPKKYYKTCEELSKNLKKSFV
jgi:hypothetical protein